MQPTEDQIADYLRADPQFFERNAQLLNEIHLPSPHGSGTVSLAERQQLAQRDKIRVLEVKLSELLQFGEENDVISAKVHRLCVDLLGAHDLDSLVNLALDNLRENFSVPHVAIRLWAQAENPQDAANPVFTPLDAPARAWSELLATPYCGPQPGLDLSDWFGETNAPLQSFALIVLRGERSLGLLAMASEDKQRFYPEMGTLYLDRIGEILSAGLSRFVA